MNLGNIILGIIVAVLVIMFFMVIIDRITQRRLLKRYKEEKDLSKHGERNRQQGRGLPEIITSGESNFKRPPQSQFRNVLPTTTPNSIGGNQERIKSTNKIDKLLGKFKR